MARRNYSRRRTTSYGSRRYGTRSSSRVSSRRGSSGRRYSARSAGGRGQTIRVVLEQPAVTGSLSRPGPMMQGTPNTGPRKSQF